MDICDFKAPRYSLSDIWAQADAFRGKYAGDNVVPVDITNIVEFKLDLNLAPISGLASSGDIEALLLGTLDTIVVDQEQFMEDRYLNRMRFSIAHEVGHLILHSSQIKALRPATIDEWIEMLDVLDNQEYITIEQQAYEFAGRLLVPPLLLKNELLLKRSIVEKILAENPQIPQESIIEYLSNSICKKFGVSYYVISKRIKREGLWPLSNIEK